MIRQSAEDPAAFSESEGIALKKVLKFLASMRFAVMLLVLLAAACAAGSVIVQQQSFAWYAEAYSERTAAVILALRLDDVYHSAWFLVMTALLCGNLLFCSVSRIRPLIRRTRSAAGFEQAEYAAATVHEDGLPDAMALFHALRMPKPVRTETAGKETLFSAKNRIGLWGAWICHVGILLLIVGFALGQATQTEYTVYGVAGQTKPIGDTPYLLKIEDYRVDLREDDTVSQYRADITVQTADGAKTQQTQISVNHPAKLFGMDFYQNSTGWAADVSVTKNEKPLQQEILCAGESLSVSDKPELKIIFRAFYPDYVFIQGQGPSTASGALRNPAVLYAVTYRDEVIGMNVLTGAETVKIDEYEVAFSNPRNYTVIQVKQDRFETLALLGGIVTLLGLFLAFYVQPQRMVAVKEESGWTVYGFCAKGGPLFAERFRDALQRQGTGGKNDAEA